MGDIMKIQITAKKDGRVRKEIVYSETQAFICIQELKNQGYKEIGMKDIV